MTDLISKKDLQVQIAHLGAYNILKSVDFDMLNAFERMRAAMYGLIKDAPAVDAVPVVHARWVQEDVDAWSCTNCGVFWTFIVEGPEENGARFCPNCGAKMDGGAEA